MPLAVFSQVTVTGPTCVIPRTTYQYLISGPWDSTSTMRICLTRGLLAGSAISCTPSGAPQASVLVTWNGGAGGVLQVTSSKGSASISVSLTDTLTGGTIPDTIKAQSMAYLAIPAIVHCSVGTGGACTPSYTYQWQQSLDLVEWSDISGATLQHLAMTRQLTQTTFVRRKVTETGSNTIAYSNVALMDVGAPPLVAVPQ